MIIIIVVIVVVVVDCVSLLVFLSSCEGNARGESVQSVSLAPLTPPHQHHHIPNLDQLLTHHVSLAFPHCCRNKNIFSKRLIQSFKHNNTNDDDDAQAQNFLSLETTDVGVKQLHMPMDLVKDNQLQNKHLAKMEKILHTFGCETVFWENILGVHAERQTTDQSASAGQRLAQTKHEVELCA